MKDEEIKLGKRIGRGNIDKSDKLTDLIDSHFQAYNAARIREICHLYEREICKDDVIIGTSITGAMTPAGLGQSCLVPMIKHNLIDWIVTTGANVYHDVHFAMNLPLHRGSPFVDDRELLDQDIVRIYDIFMPFEVLAKTDLFLMTIAQGDWSDKRMGTAEFHYNLGKHIHKHFGDSPEMSEKSFVIAAYEAGVPIYVASPGDSTLGLHIAALNLMGKSIYIDPAIDVNETSAIVYHAKKETGKSAALIWGGGAPKNFLLQTEPQLQEMWGFPIKGHDYFIQVTDARADTGGLSGATPSEAVSWNKVDPEMLPRSIVCYSDNTIVMPMVLSYLMQKNVKRARKSLFHQRESLVSRMKEDFLKSEDDPSDKPGVNKTVGLLKQVYKNMAK